jgi:hypothetical protein
MPQRIRCSCLGGPYVPKHISGYVIVLKQIRKNTVAIGGAPQKIVSFIKVKLIL